MVRVGVCAVFVPELKVDGLKPPWWVASEISEGKS